MTLLREPYWPLCVGRYQELVAVGETLTKRELAERMGRTLTTITYNVLPYLKGRGVVEEAGYIDRWKLWRRVR